jgi:hypothetical protein
MTKLRNMVGIAFVAMGLLTGFAATSASAQEAPMCVQDSDICFVMHELVLADSR